ncbi:hypothetical protein J2R80_008319 [Bradyrhizobium sp. USDA 4541]|nr:hypothetical protein [Bradyrhizobium sp. USDA 4541]
MVKTLAEHGLAFPFSSELVANVREHTAPDLLRVDDEHRIIRSLVAQMRCLVWTAPRLSTVQEFPDGQVLAFVLAKETARVMKTSDPDHKTPVGGGKAVAMPRRKRIVLPPIHSHVERIASEARTYKDSRALCGPCEDASSAICCQITGMRMSRAQFKRRSENSPARRRRTDFPVASASSPRCEPMKPSSVGTRPPSAPSRTE